MSDKPKIRWTEKQRKKLNSAVRKYNNAVRKAMKADPNASVYLPEEVSYQEVKAGIKTARELQNKVNALLRVKKEGALEPVRVKDGFISQYERREYNIFKSVRERKKRMAARSRGVTQPVEGELGTYEQSLYTPDTRKAEELSPGGIKRALERMGSTLSRYDEVENTRRWRDNYLKALDSVLGVHERTSLFVERMRDRLESIDDMDELYQLLSNAPSIDFIYDILGMAAIIERLGEYWGVSWRV